MNIIHFLAILVLVIIQFVMVVRSAPSESLEAYDEDYYSFDDSFECAHDYD